VGQVIGIIARSRELEYFKALAEVLRRREVQGWLSLDVVGMSGRILSAPSRPEIDANLQEQLIVEYYSR